MTFGLAMGGIETMLVNIANEQASNGHDVHVFVVNDVVDRSLLASFSTAVKVHLTGRRPGSLNPVPYFRLNRGLLSIKPDVVHLHFIKLASMIWIPSLRRKMCTTLHSMASLANTRHIRHCGPVFVISDMVRDDVERRFGIKATTVYNGVNLSKIQMRDDRQLSHPMRIVQVGRLEHKVKGQDILLQAAATMKARGFEDFVIDFIGDGSSRAFLEDLARRLGVDVNVRFLGSRPQEYVFEHLRDYDLFVLPSRLEGFALTVAEAMAARVPVVVSDSQAPFEVIARGRYGMSYHGESADDCARVIMDYALRGYDPAAADGARRYAALNFDIAATASRYAGLYSSIF